MKTLLAKTQLVVVDQLGGSSNLNPQLDQHGWEPFGTKLQTSPKVYVLAYFGLLRFTLRKASTFWS